MSYSPLFVTKYTCSGAYHATLDGKLDPNYQRQMLNKQVVGSIYFDWGRVRLIYPDGPVVEPHTRITRRTMTEAQYTNFKAWRETIGNTSSYTGMSHDDKVQQLEVLGANCFNMNSAERLIEVCDGHYHPSRGCPEGFAADAAVMQALCNMVERINSQCIETATRNNSVFVYLQDKGLLASLGYQ